MNADVRSNPTDSSNPAEPASPIVIARSDQDTLSWAKERLDSLAHRRRQLLKQCSLSALPIALSISMLTYMGGSARKWEHVEAIIGEDGVGIVLLIGVIAFVVLVRALYILSTHRPARTAPMQRLAEHGVRYVPAGLASVPCCYGIPLGRRCR